MVRTGLGIGVDMQVGVSLLDRGDLDVLSLIGYYQSTMGDTIRSVYEY